MNLFALFMDIVSIIVSLISIFVSIVTITDQGYYIPLRLLIINLTLLMILAVVIISQDNRIRKYRNLIKNNKYYSFIYASYIDMKETYRTSKISGLKVQIEITKNDKEINDSREYSFSCITKENQISLYFLNETGSMTDAEVVVNSHKRVQRFSGVGDDCHISGIRNIISKVDIDFEYVEQKNMPYEVTCKYNRNYEINKNNCLIYVIYPKMFSNYKKRMTIVIELNDEQRVAYIFKLISIGAEKEEMKLEGVLSETHRQDGKVTFRWSGKVDPKKVYFLRGEPEP